MRSQLLKYRPPRIAMALLVMAAVFQWSGPLRTFDLFSSVPASLVLASIGFAVMLFAWWQFQERAVAICPTEPTEYLITDGVYKFTRNPMYLGIVLMLSGVATIFGTLPFYAAAIGYFVVMDRLFCRYEEEKLATAFGLEYARYKSNVRRWI